MSVETVGCECGKAEHTQEWDSVLQAYYHIYHCDKCNYYWEGPIYDGTDPYYDYDKEIAELKQSISFNEQFKSKDNELDAPGLLDISLDKIHEKLMELSEEKPVIFNISGTEYKVKAIFDEISNGDKYYTYEIDKSDIMELKGLTFFQTYKFLENELEKPYVKEESTMLSRFKSKEHEIEHER